MSDRFICIHGHFYQPPRENPWLEDVEVQDSAAPYHDWNERIAAECYAPNAVSRVLDSEGRIAELVNNYEKISFNFGPTLLSWLERHRSEVYKQILDADRRSRNLRGGHGNAIAQCYNHVIMSLASAREKLTQVRWGIADFKHRFGREPEGIWLPETAVDLATLQALADHNIKFTILAPNQAQEFRASGGEWQQVSQGNIDPTRAYRCHLSDGKHIDLFFYDAPVSHDLAFAGLLKDGNRLVARLMNGFHDERAHSQLMHVATDGETFGHHAKFGDMAVAYAISRIEREGVARITNYGEYLALHPPDFEVRIRENTSWSCAHGVERWRSDCGCNSGNTRYHQRWREPLRQVFDWLRSKLDIVFEFEASGLLRERWAAFDDYISVILDRSPENCGLFFGRHASHALTDAERVKTWRLLEMQRHAALMYTSCGWFFDDISNIETVKVIEYAARAAQLACEASGIDLEPEFVRALETVPGNKPALPTGARVYEELVKPSIADLKKVLAHYGISTLVEDYAPEQRIFSYSFERKDYRRERIASRTLAVGAVGVKSSITAELFDGIFVMLHLGGYDFHCVVREQLAERDYAKLKDKLFHSFAGDSTRALLHEIDAGLAGETFALKDLFVDERRKIGRLLLEDAIERSGDHYKRIYEESRDVMRLLASLGIPAPASLKQAAEFVLTSRLEVATERLYGGEISDIQLNELVGDLLREAESQGCKIDISGLKEALERVVYSRLDACRNVKDEASTESALRFLKLADQLDVGIDLWRLQNLFWEILKESSNRLQPSMRALGKMLRFSESVVRQTLTAGP